MKFYIKEQTTGIIELTGSTICEYCNEETKYSDMRSTVNYNHTLKSKKRYYSKKCKKCTAQHRRKENYPDYDKHFKKDRKDVRKNTIRISHYSGVCLGNKVEPYYVSETGKQEEYDKLINLKFDDLSNEEKQLLDE